MIISSDELAKEIEDQKAKGAEVKEKLVQKEGELKQTRGEVPWAKIGQLELYNGNNLQPPHLPLGSALKQL